MKVETEIWKQFGIEKLNPMQEKAVAEGLLTEDKIVVSSPTASGKTLLAKIKLKQKLDQNLKTAYIVPLRSLASEKFKEFQKDFPNHKVTLSLGDYESDESIRNADLLITTIEKFDSILRNSKQAATKYDFVVIDEVHLLGEAGRGATLEIILTKLKLADCKFLLLSATIPNSKELTEWINGKLIQSEYRPVPLRKGIFYGENIIFPENDELIQAEDFLEVVTQAIEEGRKQILIFVSSRKNAENTAKELSNLTIKYLTPEEKKELKIISKKIEEALTPPTIQCKNLAECISKGTSFHHAGLIQKDREYIEEAFKEKKLLKIIVATTTLAMGIDYPASWVLIKDIKRYNGAFSDLLPKNEIIQMMGRAGRPKYDTQGTSIVFCNEKDARKVVDQYFSGKMDAIYSQLSREPDLRMHSLSLIASLDCKTREELLEFFNNTFYCKQYGDISSKIEKTLDTLKELDLVRAKGKLLLTTPLGKKISELYLDPYTGYAFSQTKQTNEFDLLFTICNTPELKPGFRVRKEEEELLWDQMYAVLSEENAAILQEQDSLDTFKTATVFHEWINEKNENELLEQYDVLPGILQGKLKNAEWLMHSLAEISFLKNNTSVYEVAKKLNKRIVDGVKEELLELCTIRGIGRIRARRLHNAGVKTLEDFKSKSKDEIQLIIYGKTRGQQKIN